MKTSKTFFKKISHCSLIIFVNSASTKILQNYRFSSSGAGMHQGKFAAGQRRWNTSAVKVRCKRCHWNGNPFRRAVFLKSIFSSAAHVSPGFFFGHFFFHMKELVHPKNPVDMCGEVAAPFFGVFEKRWFISFCCFFFQTVRHSSKMSLAVWLGHVFFPSRGHWTILRSVSS